MIFTNRLFKNNKLNREIEKIPQNKRFIKKNEDSFDGLFCKDSCVFGMSTSVDFEVLNHIPKQTKGLYFYYGTAAKDLLEEMTKLEVIQNIEYLTIGFTHGNDMQISDYSEISKILARTHFPKLKSFEYGIDELTANEHCVYGNLGDITGILENMPMLEKLYLYGNFELLKSLHFNTLTDIEVVMDDFVLNINGGRISNPTIHHLLSSQFEELRLLALNLDFNDEIFEYSLPSIFLTGQNAQKLEHFEISGNFVKGTKEEISKSELLNREFKTLFFDEIDELKDSYLG